jgi:hypothetical protein
VYCKGGGLRLSISACYSCEIALNVGLSIAFSGMYVRLKRAREKAGEVHNTKACIRDDETPH